MHKSSDSKSTREGCAGARYLEIQNVQGGSRASGTPTAEIPTFSRLMRLVKLGNPSRTGFGFVSGSREKKYHFHFI